MRRISLIIILLLTIAQLNVSGSNSCRQTAFTCAYLHNATLINTFHRAAIPAVKIPAKVSELKTGEQNPGILALSDAFPGFNYYLLKLLHGLYY